jgi:hypothetical protein
MNSLPTVENDRKRVVVMGSEPVLQGDGIVGCLLILNEHRNLI